MRLRKNHRKAFLAYFTFILCIMIVILPLFFSALRAVEEQTVQSSRDTLIYGLKQLEMELDSVYQMCKAIGNNQNLTTLSTISPNVLDPGPGKLPAIMNVKTHYESLFRMLKFTTDVGFILPNHIVITGNRIHMPAEPFWGTYLYADGIESLDDWLAYIRAAGRNYSFDNISLKRYGREIEPFVLFSLPMILTRSEGSYCYALIGEETLLSTLVYNHLLAHSSFSLTWDNLMLVDYAANNISDNTIHVEEVSNSYGLVARLEIDRTFFASQLRDFYRIGALFLIAYLLFGIVMALIYSYYSVTPLTQTVKAIHEVTELPCLQEDYKDAYTYIHHFITEADKHLKENKLALANQEIRLKENLMERILRGHLFRTSATEMINKNFPNFPLPCIMYIVQFLNCGTLKPQQFANLQVKARCVAEEFFSSQTVLHFSADMLIILCNGLGCTAEIEQALCEQLENRTDFNVRMCVSQPFYTPDEINTVFMRLHHLMRVTAANQTLIREKDQNIMQPYQGVQHTSRFYEALMRNQQESALNLINEECAMLQNNYHITETEVRQFFYCYRNVLYQAIMVGGLSPDEIALPYYDANASLNDLMSGIRTCVVDICAAQTNRLCMQVDQREKDILRTINDELDNPDFNITIIMESFGISNRALQNLMRQATGTTFMDYVNTQRMERARHLLCSTDMSIQDVCTACGYASVNTFYKAFQRTWSITPRVMRDNNMEDSSDQSN
ncbi:MAG: helix-turn-helix transcriptional regulator [Christensenellales bacterium]|jgi:AraC-like DNA-binding protein